MVVGLLGFTRYTTSVLHNTVMLGPSHPDTRVHGILAMTVLASRMPLVSSLVALVAAVRACGPQSAMSKAARWRTMRSISSCRMR